MHRQVNALVSAGGSPGKLAIFGKALGDAGLDMEAIGGAEWMHDGPLCLTLRHDGSAAMDKFGEVCHELKVPWLSFAIVSVELDDTPGELGRAAEAIGDDINIYRLLVRKPHGNRAVVDLGFRPADADEAESRLRAAGFTANRKHHPDEPDDGMIAWDERTESLLDLWDDPDVPKNDPRFWQMAGSS
jgi:hypothetical protein